MTAKINAKTIAAQKNREKILKTTLQLLLKKGSTNAVSTSDICNAAKITKPTLYYYFKSKYVLLSEIHSHLIDEEIVPILNKALQIEDTMERFSFIIRSYTKHIYEHPELRILIHDSLIIKDKRFKVMRDEWKKVYYVLRDTITKLKLEKKIDKNIKHSQTALFILGMITWITYWLDFSRQDEASEIEETALKFILDGVKGIKN